MNDTLLPNWAMVLCLLFGHVVTQPRIYPEELHRRVMEKLHQRGERGTWSPWSTWSSCSRSCGTGVMIQSRDCLSASPENDVQSTEASTTCFGKSKRFQLCNVQDCPQALSDFRKVQCESFNRTPFNRVYYSWEPYFDRRPIVMGSESCALNCRASGLNFYATLNQTVIDGTPCGAFQPQLRLPNSVCVGGKCLRVGCDGLLDSGREVDVCGVCGGNNSTCRFIAGLYARQNLPFGYNLIATLPPKAENLSFYHTKPSSNYLALRELGGRYLLNGPWGMNSSGSFGAVGTIFSYSRPHAHGGDHLYAQGPTTRPLEVMLFYQTPDPGVIYEYRLPASATHPGIKPTFRLVQDPRALKASYQNEITPAIVNDAIFSNSVIRTVATDFKDSKKIKTGLKKSAESSKKSQRRKKYKWIEDGLTPCSQTCGGGTRSTRTICVKRTKALTEVPAYFCVGLTQPPEEVHSCNLHTCSPEWETGDWSECSVTCDVGIQTRSIFCGQRISTNVTIKVPDDQCQKSPEILTAQACQMKPCIGNPRWEVHLWSSCSSECGLGYRKRDVICTNSEEKVNEELCTQEKPIEKEICDMGSCATDTWMFSPWENTCRGPCGDGVQRRRVFCLTDPSVGGSSCSKEDRPEKTRNCESKKNCAGSWFVGPWSECDSLCGTGIQRRDVVCLWWSKGRFRVQKGSSSCKMAGKRPADSKACAVDCKPRWFTSEWSSCSETCGNGVQRREVKCLDQQNKPSLECSSATKPDSRQNCNIASCSAEPLNDTSTEFLQRPPNDSSVDQFSHQRDANENPKDETQQRVTKSVCLDRMKNCHLVYKARLCTLKYYKNLCCKTCPQKN